MNWLFGTHLLWWDTLFSLDTVWKGMILHQLGKPDFFDSPRETLSSTQNWMGRCSKSGRKLKKNIKKKAMSPNWDWWSLVRSVTSGSHYSLLLEGSKWGGDTVSYCYFLEAMSSTVRQNFSWCIQERTNSLKRSTCYPKHCLREKDGKKKMESAWVTELRCQL